MYEPIKEGNIGYIFDNDEGRIIISMYFFDENKDDILRTLDFCHGGLFGDFEIGLWDPNLEDNAINTDVVIKSDNLLYESIRNLLKNQNSLLIDSDDVNSIKEKYLSIEQGNDCIIFKFNKKPDRYDIENFGVYIKNTRNDLRSKIDQDDLDTKHRLYKFFNEAFKVLTNYNKDESKIKIKQ